jgi:hypothetical protein
MKVQATGISDLDRKRLGDRGPNCKKRHGTLEQKHIEQTKSSSLLHRDPKPNNTKRKTCNRDENRGAGSQIWQVDQNCVNNSTQDAQGYFH